MRAPLMFRMFSTTLAIVSSLSACTAPVSPAAPAMTASTATRESANESATTKAKPPPSDVETNALHTPEQVFADPHRLATQLCTAALKTPAVMAARCCERKPDRVDVSTCVAALEAGFAAKRLRALGVSRCFTDLEASLAGCDWVGGDNRVPLSCRGVVEGIQDVGAPCAGPWECSSGSCAHGICAARDDATANSCGALAGALIRSECAPGAECLEGACVTTCGAGCHPSERCVSGSCVAAKVPGQVCARDDECIGACVEGLCAMRCGAGREVTSGATE